MADVRAPEYGSHQEVGRQGQPMLNETEARQAQPMGVMRYVLIVSTALTVIGFCIAYLAEAT